MPLLSEVDIFVDVLVYGDSNALEILSSLFWVMLLFRNVFFFFFFSCFCLFFILL